MGTASTTAVRHATNTRCVDAILTWPKHSNAKHDHAKLAKYAKHSHAQPKHAANEHAAAAEHGHEPEYAAHAESHSEYTTESACTTDIPISISTCSLSPTTATE